MFTWTLLGLFFLGGGGGEKGVNSLNPGKIH